MVKPGRMGERGEKREKHEIANRTKKKRWKKG